MPLPTITFRVNLCASPSQDMLRHADVETFAKHKTIHIPGLRIGTVPKKHGDTFTLSGQQAVYLKNLILQSHVSPKSWSLKREIFCVRKD